MTHIKTYNTLTKRYESNSKAYTTNELFSNIQMLEETIKTATGQLSVLKQKLMALVLYSK
jgi:hypothetical protein